jgi:hypothetical protein
MFKTIIRTTACLAVSAAAFIVTAKMDAAAAARSRSAAPAAEPAEPPAAPKSTPAPKKPKEPPPKLTVASLNVPATTAPAAATTATTTTTATTASAKAVLDSTLLTVPDWKGKRLSVARREARKLGLHIKATDDSGEEIPANVASRYRVRVHFTAAGAQVEPGAEVAVFAKEIYAPAVGY